MKDSMVVWAKSLSLSYSRSDRKRLCLRWSPSTLLNYFTKSKVIYKFNLYNRTPYFELKGLEPGQGYEIYLYARNKKGKSLSFNLQAFTLKNPEKQTGTYPIAQPF